MVIPGRAGFNRPRVFSVGVQAIGHAQAGEIDQACAAACELIPLAAGLQSGRVARRLAEVVHALEPHATFPAVRTIREAARPVLAGRPASGPATGNGVHG
jgi:hypothetical protein